MYAFTKIINTCATVIHLDIINGGADRRAHVGCSAAVLTLPGHKAPAQHDQNLAWFDASVLASSVSINI